MRQSTLSFSKVQSALNVLTKLSQEEKQFSLTEFHQSAAPLIQKALANGYSEADVHLVLSKAGIVFPLQTVEQELIKTESSNPNSVLANAVSVKELFTLVKQKSLGLAVYVKVEGQSELLVSSPLLYPSYQSLPCHSWSVKNHTKPFVAFQYYSQTVAYLDRVATVFKNPLCMALQVRSHTSKHCFFIYRQSLKSSFVSSSLSFFLSFLESDNPLTLSLPSEDPNFDYFGSCLAKNIPATFTKDWDEYTIKYSNKPAKAVGLEFVAASCLQASKDPRYLFIKPNTNVVYVNSSIVKRTGYMYRTPKSI